MNSRDSPVNVSNAGSFSKHWIVLMSDVLAHAGYSSVTTHPLKAIWIEGHSQQVWKTLGKGKLYDLAKKWC